MDAAELDYPLPAEAIAQTPVEPRDAARLLVDRGTGAPPDHRTVADLADLLDPADVLVVNDTEVIPARLHLRKATGGAVEVLLLERRPEGWWEALVRPGRRVPPGTVLTPATPEAGAGAGPDLTLEVGEDLGEGRRRVTLTGGADDDLATLAWWGEVPLPPYIHEPLADPARYQTVFAAHPGSVAAPTAGLHLTPDLLARCRERGIAVLRVQLVVGLGTFRPITEAQVEDHPMHAERYRIPADVQAALGPRLGPHAHAGERVAGGEGAGPGQGRVVAVGTTVVRALESWAATGETDGPTSLFIHGAYPFALVDRLVTNFHVPRSSLLALVESFAGPHWRDLYAEALATGYRFLSFGDAMLLSRAERGAPGPRS